MKKWIVATLLVTIMTITISGCNSKSVGIDMPVDGNKPPMETASTKLLQGFEGWEDSEAISALKRVLSLQETITDASPSGAASSEFICKEYYLNELDAFLGYEFDTMMIPDQYAVVDLNQDGQPEVVVSLLGCGGGWIKVLRYYEGTVYGYSFVVRGFDLLKTDGTYMDYSEESNNCIRKLNFDGKMVHENCLGFTSSSKDEMMYHIGDEEVSEQEYSTFIENYYNKQDVTWYLFQSKIRASYEGQELLRLDFTARTHAQVQDMEEYYSGMNVEELFSHSSLIPEELCELILDAMEQGTEQETFTPLIVDTDISQEEFCSETGLEWDGMESAYPVRVDADNDGVQDLIAQCYWGGSAGYSSMEFCKKSEDGQYKQTSTLACLIQEFGFLQYKGKQYLLMTEFDYNTKCYSGNTLYLYENGILADGKVFSFVVDDYDMDTVFEDAAFEEINSVKKALSNKKMPDILFHQDGVICGSAETKYDSDASEYEYSSDLNNDGKQEYYNKSMWYPSNMGTVMCCSYEFENSMIIDDLCNRLSGEMGNGTLYTFWLDKVNGKNILYLYYGKDLDYTLYAYLINRFDK
ncbi:hypothetical protein [Anaeromicropila populeti]|uniref:Uncharacterized protein n=1 Tax=Anaeromicropila populeti TaxID=37658 RepID=A0A1I6HTW0_9FIRM|nr:hypothetical protein [Anaeromicropila populeti]SFR57680.1 hypothetical protein SAMN05661086_00271 [Anaeromicropila populeti]